MKTKHPRRQPLVPRKLFFGRHSMSTEREARERLVARLSYYNRMTALGKVRPESISRGTLAFEVRRLHQDAKTGVKSAEASTLRCILGARTTDGVSQRGAPHLEPISIAVLRLPFSFSHLLNRTTNC